MSSKSMRMQLLAGVAVVLFSGLALAQGGGPKDRKPDAFDFGTKTQTFPNTVVESDSRTLTGFDTATTINPGKGAQYRVGSGNWTSSNGTLNPGQVLQVRHLTDAAGLAETRTSLTVGGVTGYFTTRNRSSTNNLPTANAGNDQVADENAAVTLTGSGSDLEGPVTYSWAQTGGPEVTLADAGTASASFTAPEVNGDEVLTFELTVTDDVGATARDEVQVTALDTRTLSIGDATVDEAAGTLELTMTVTPAAGKAITVDYGTADVTARDGKDYVGGNGALAIPAGGEVALIIIPITADSFDENDEIFTVGLTNAQGAVIANGLATVTIVDDDTSNLLRIGAAKRSVAPSDTHIAGAEESRVYADAEGNVGTQKQQFGLGGYGLSQPESLANPTYAHIGNGFATGNYLGLEEDGAAHSTYVRAFVIEEPNGEVVAFVTLDAVGAGNIIQNHLKAAITAATGIPGDNVLFGQTHSHSAADLQGLWGGVPATWLDCDATPEKLALDGCGENGWTQGLYQLAAEAVKDAYDNRVPAELRLAAGTLDKNRRRTLQVTPDQNTDKAMTVLQARAPGDDVAIGTILQYAAHPTILGDDTRLVNGDFVVAGLTRLEREGGTALYYNGPIADTSPSADQGRDCVAGESNGYCRARTYGRDLADNALSLLRTRAVEVAPTLSVRHATDVMLPVTNPAFLAAGLGRMFNRYYNFVETPVDDVPQVAMFRNELPQVAPFATTTVSRVTLGNPAADAGLEIATIPGEGRNALGQLIRYLAYGEQKDSKPMMLLGLTHNSFGYIIPEEEFGGAFHQGELYEEIVSLGPLTAPLLRLQAYFPLFDVPQGAYAPLYVTTCQAAPDSDACMLEILRYRIGQTPGYAPVGGAIDDALDQLAASCRENSPLPQLCSITDALADFLDDGAPSGVVTDPIDPLLFDCTGPAGDPAEGTPEFAFRDAENIFCTTQRHHDSLQQPANNPYMVENYGADPYRAAARHAGTRFRHAELNIPGVDGQAGTSFDRGQANNAEIYRPCAAGTCENMPAGLQTFEPPYPIAIVMHGAASDKKHLEWATQPLAERGYFVLTANGTGNGLPGVLLDWLFDPANPYAAELDLSRIGTTGHSLGAENATRVQGDARVSGIVAWDNCDGSGGNECRDSSGSRLHDKGALAKTPTLFLTADYLGFPGYPQPQTSVPGDLRLEGFGILRNNGVDTMLVTPRATTHLDWAGAFTFGNRLNEATSLYYTLSWFDRYVNGKLVVDGDGNAVASHGRSEAGERAYRQAIADGAFARLTAPAFDGLVDLHNISQGRWDRLKALASGDMEFGGNVPYRVTGLALADRLSFYHRSVCFISRPDLTTGDGSQLLARADTTEDGDMRATGCTVGQAPEDRDGDGVPDAQDAFPDDPAESADADGDGTGNNADTDDDNDGVADVSDECPTQAGTGANGCPEEPAQGFPIRFEELCDPSPFAAGCMDDIPGVTELQGVLDTAWNAVMGEGEGNPDATLVAAAANAAARGCDILDPSYCLYPFPNDHFTVDAAPGSPQAADQGGSGRRVNFNIAAMPRNVAGKPIDPSEWNRNDGFSPGQMILTYVPELGTVKDAEGNPLGPVKGAVPITDLSQSLRDDASVFVMDVTEGAPEYGQKQLAWAEIDLNAGFLLPSEGVAQPDPTKPRRAALIVRPAKNLLEGHRYAVVLRNLQRDDGSIIAAGDAFAACLDEDFDSALPPVAARCAHLRDKVFPALEDADVDLDPDTLFLAWDFTVASTANNVGRLKHMRDDAFASLGDTGTLAAGQPGFPQGRAPSFTITSVRDNPSAPSARQVKGTFRVPSYLVPADDVPLPSGAPAGQASLPPNHLFYNPADATPADPTQAPYGDGLPDRNPAGDLTANFTCNIPKAALSGKDFATATAADIRAARPSLYGHGLLGSHTEGGIGNGDGQTGALGNEQNIMICATDWYGFASGDLGNVASVLPDVSNFRVIPDASQQGVLNFLFLARLMSHPDGFAGRPEFRLGGTPVFDTREVFYDGNSQGGILGGPVVAMSRDIHRGVLGVPGMNYSTLLSRSVDFDLYSIPLYLAYPDDLDRGFIFSIMQMLWDRSENNGYAHHITDSSALDAPGNTVLLHPAFADHQVSMWTAEVMARTVGASVDRSRITAERHPDEVEYFALETLDYGDGAQQRGSALVVWNNDEQPAPPIGNVSPREGNDPHSFPRNQKVGRCQKGNFLQREGVLVEVPARDTVAGDFACPVIVNEGAPGGEPEEPPVAGLPPADPHGIAGCLLTQDAALCQAAVESFAGFQDCPFDESGINCAYEIIADAVGVDTAAQFVSGLFAQCGASGAAPACEAIRSGGNGAVPDRVIVASRMIPRGDLAYTEQPAAVPSAKAADGAVDDWMGQSTRIGGTDIFEFGEHIYTDFLFDAFGADDGDDARRLAILAALGDASDRTGRIDALQQAGNDQLDVPPPGGTNDGDHYGNGANREDGTDLTEVRWGADGSDLHLLARVAKLQDPANLVVVVLADQFDGEAGLTGLDAGLTTSIFDRALVLRAGGGQVFNSAAGGTPVPLDVAVSASGYDNALEARIPRAYIERPDGSIRVAVMTMRQDGTTLVPANVAYRYDEPVTIYSERAQALSLFAGSVDPFAKVISVRQLTDGRSQSARPGFGYHERQFTSGANISVESDSENGRLQPYGVFVPSAIKANDEGQARLTIWTHYRGGKAHSGAAWTPRLFWQLGEEQGNLVISPRARGTSTWYTTRAHQDFFEVFADFAGTKRLNQYADENLPADHTFAESGLFEVDPSRIYISGYSMGGFATYLFTGLYPDLFAGGFSQSGAVTQGAWTGIGPNPGDPGHDETCGYTAPEDFPEVGGGSPCFIEANNGRANAQLNFRLLDNTRHVPLTIHHGTNDELALTPGAVRMGQRLNQLGYRHDMTLFLGYEHFTQAIVDEWADGAHYLNLFARPENPRVVTYKVVPALVKAVNEVQLSGVNGNQPFNFHPDGAYWIDDLVVRDDDGAPHVSGQIDAESGRLAGATYQAVPRSGASADADNPYASTPVYSPGNHSTPYVREGIDWVETGTLAGDANTFEATLANLSHARLDLARMGFAGHFSEAIAGTVTSDGAATLVLAGVGADMTACVGSAAVGEVASGSDAAIELAAGESSVRLLPGFGADCAATPPPPPEEPSPIDNLTTAIGNIVANAQTTLGDFAETVTAYVDGLLASPETAAEQVAAAADDAMDQAGVVSSGNPWMQRRPLNISHRGGENDWPENTMFAYAESIRAAGSDMIEMDIYESADGELVVIHDATVDRTTDGSGDVSSFTLAQLRALDAAHWFARDASGGGHGTNHGRDESEYVYRGIATGARPLPGELAALGYGPADFRIPTLREIFENPRFSNVFINVELKPDPDSTGQYEAKLAALIREYGRGEDVMVASFLDHNLALFKANAPEIATSVPTGQAAVNQGAGTGPGLGATAGHKAFQVPTEFSGIEVLSAEYVADAHARGMAVHAWTINDRETMIQLLNWCVDGIMSDRPLLLEEVLQGNEWSCGEAGEGGGAKRHLVGSIHEHSGFSDGAVGTSPADYFQAGLDHGLDFMAGTEHSDNGMLPVTANADCISADFAACFQASPDGVQKWNASARIADEKNRPGEFSAIRGFEWTSDRFGHINVLFSKNDLNAKSSTGYAVSMEDFWQWLALPPSRMGGADGVAIFNHPGREVDVENALTQVGAGGDPAYAWNDLAFRPEHDQRVVGIELYGKSGDYYDDKADNGAPEGGWYSYALDKGWHVAPVGAEDEHGHEWAKPQRAKTVILAADNTRAALRAALVARNFYAVRHGHGDLRISFSSGGQIMGARLVREAGEQVAFDVEVEDLTPASVAAARIEVVGPGGEVLETAEGLSHTFTATASATEQWRFVRVLDATGKVLAVSAPIWFRPPAAAPPGPGGSDAPDVADLCTGLSVSQSAPLCAALREAETQLREQCEANGGPEGFCTLTGGNLHALIDTCYAGNPGEDMLPACRIVDAFVGGAAAACRAPVGPVPSELCALIGGVQISGSEVFRYQLSWVHRALSHQGRLGFRLPLAHNTLLHTHNSFNAADDNEPQTLSGSDYNQHYDIRQQLAMDIRAIEVDVHWVPGRDGSAGTLGHEPMACHGRAGSELNAGCTTEKPLREVLADIRYWLEQNPDEAILLYIEDDIGGTPADEDLAHATTAQVIERELGARVFRPADHGASCGDANGGEVASSWLNVSRQAMLDAGRQVLLVTETCAGGAWDSLFHQKNDGNWQQGTQASYAGRTYATGNDQCLFAGARRDRFTRVWEDSTVVTATAGGGAPAALTPEVTRELVRCGLNLPGFDRLTPTDGRLEAAVWSWAPGYPTEDLAPACALHRADGRFVNVHCNSVRRPFACVADADPDAWVVAGFGDGFESDGACPAGYHFSVPANGFANEKLKEAKVAAGVGEVWLNYSRDSHGAWHGDGVGDPPRSGMAVGPDPDHCSNPVCAALDSLSAAVNETVSVTAGYDFCEPNSGLCLSQIPYAGNVLLNLLEPVLNTAPRGLWLKGDMHVHDDHSADGSGTRQVLGQGAPGNTDVSDQITFAESVGLEFLPLTDHRTFDQHYDPGWRSDKLLLITGEEANGGPHANVFGALDMINQADNPAGAPQVRKLQQSIWDAHLQGAVWQTNHPDDGELETDDGAPRRDERGEVVPNGYAYAAGPNLVEIWNRGTLNLAKIEYCENRWNAGHRFGIAGASDNHFRELWPIAGPGEPTTFVFAAERSTPALLEGLRAGHTAVRLNASAPFVTLAGDFDHDGTFETIMGDEARMEPRSGATLRITVENGIGTQVVVYRKPGLKAHPVATFVPTVPKQHFYLDIWAEREALDWYRVEVRGAGDPDAAAYGEVPGNPQGVVDPGLPLRALTSPIFISTGAPAAPQSPELPADAGVADGAQLLAGSGADSAFAGFASIAEADGVVHAVSEVRAEGASKVLYRRIGTDGVPGEAFDLAPDSRLATVPRIAAQGSDVWAVWQDNRAGEMPHNPQVYARHSADGGFTWDDEIRVSDSAGRAEHPALALLAPHLPVIVWQDNGGGAFDVLARVLARDEAPVNLSAAGKTVIPGNGYDTRSAIYPASVRPSVAVSADGAIAVAWQDNRNDADAGWTGHDTTVESVSQFKQPQAAGTQTDDWEIFSRALPAGASAWTLTANVSGAPTQADRNVTLAFDAAGALHAAWDTKENRSMAGPRLSIQAARSSDLGDTWSESQPVALDAQFSSQRPAFGRNGDALSLFWMDGRSADWRWRVMRADHDGTAFADARFVTGPGNAAWPSFSNGWLAFTSDRNATREQRKPQQAFLVQLDAAQAATAVAGDTPGTQLTQDFDLCAGSACVSDIPVLGPAVLAALEPVFTGGPTTLTDAVTDALLDACRAVGVPEVLCARAEDIFGTGGLSRWIDPRIGSHPPGFTNPGPFAPWGMVQPGPDTEGPINYGGYYGHNSLITGLSQVHMSAGVYKAGYFPVLPFTGADPETTDLFFGQDHPVPAYASTFDHAAEAASAGYYSALLSRYGVLAELTATERVALHRYTFNDPTQAPRILFDISRTPDDYRNATVELRSGGVLVGSLHTGAFPVYFAARVSAPFTAKTFDGAALAEGGSASGNALGVILDLADATQPVLVKIGVSYTDGDGALANLDAEIPGWDFEAVRASTVAAWDEALALIEVEGGTDADRTSFYTALARVQQFPNLHSDVDGRYRGPDGAIHHDTRPHYSQFSSWDSYRGQNQVQAEIVPGRYADMVHSLLAFHEQAGFLPRWQEGSHDASHMSGDPIIPFIGEAWCRGDIDVATRQQLWPALTNLVTRRDAQLRDKGYLAVEPIEQVQPPEPFPQIPGTGVAPVEDARLLLAQSQDAVNPTGGGAASATLEYGIADFSLALMAQAVPGADAAPIAQRSLNYRNLFDPETKWIRPRNADGSWLTPFLPENGYGFQEGTSWQYSWMSMHDYAGVVSRMGGDTTANERLDVFFNLPASAASPVVWPTVQNQITAFGISYVGNQYAPGNEHDLEAPWVYNYTGAPWKSQAVARAAASIYTPTATGLPGNDDLGALSGWLVWTMSGVYPMNPGTPLVVIGSPVFEKVTMHRPSGDFVIEAPGASAANKYVQSVAIDGRTSPRSWLVLPRERTRVRIEMGAAPNLSWATEAGHRPPSLSTHALSAFGCGSAPPPAPQAPRVDIGAQKVTIANGAFERTWTRSPFRTEQLVDSRTGKVWSQNSADFSLVIGGAEIASDQFEVSGTPSVERRPNGAVRTTFTLTPRGFLGVPVGLTITRVIETYPGVAGMRSETWLNSAVPLVISGYSLDESRPVGAVGGTIHSFRAGADWRNPGDPEEWTPQVTIGDAHAGDWRESASGAAVSGGAQWLSVADSADRRLFYVMERNDYASSMMSLGAGRARAHVDLSRDVIYLGPIEESAHVENPGPGPGRQRAVMPGVPLRLEPVFTGFGTSGDDEPWQHYKYLANFRMPPYRREVTFNSNNVDSNRISTGAKDDMDFAETQRQAAIAAELGVETFILDDGWQARSGDWCPDSVSEDPACADPRRASDPVKFAPRFPDSEFSAVQALLQSSGMNLGLWMTPLHLHPESIAFKSNPQWGCWPINAGLLAIHQADPDGGSNEAGILQWNLAATGPNGKAIDYIEGRIRRAIVGWGVKYFKFDFTVWLDCGGASPVDMYGYRESFMAMLDRILADHPDVTIQMDETNDYRLFPFEALARGPTWYQNGSPETRQSLHANHVLLPFLPPYALGRAALRTGDLANGKSADYQMAVALLSHFTFFNNLAQIPAEVRPQIRAWIEYFKAHREDFAQFTYPLLAEDPLAGDTWAAFQAWNPDAGRGALLVYRQDTDESVKTIRLRNVPDGTYRLFEAPDDQPAGVVSAEELREGIEISLPSINSAKVLRIERRD